jgi:hypothetical protein
MATPNDLLKQRYEVIKLKTGTEFVGMVRDTTEGLEVTLPMICHLSVQQPINSTLATFYPYAPMSEDPIVKIPFDQVLHRSNMNSQFIPFYDEASANWLKMVETGSIPLTNDLKGVSREYMKKAVDSILKNVKDEDLFDEFYEELVESEFEEAIKPTDPKKIH